MEEASVPVRRVALSGATSGVEKAEQMVRDALGRNAGLKFGKFTCAQCGRWWTTTYMVEDGRATWSECQGCRARRSNPEELEPEERIENDGQHRCDLCGLCAEHGCDNCPPCKGSRVTGRQQ